MRVPFTKVFTPQPDGSFTPITKVQLKGCTLNPGVWLGDGMMVADLNLGVLKGRDLELQVAQGCSVIQAAY